MAEVVVIGAGLGGLACATKLARAGKSVLLLEKKAHTGGTSYIFRRGPYAFPMGPMSFSYPARVTSILEELGVELREDFTRRRYQVVAPGLDIVYSQPLRTLQKDLNRIFPGDIQGIETVLAALEEIGSSPSAEKSARLRFPDSLLGASLSGKGGLHGPQACAPDLVGPAGKFLERHISSPLLRNFLGSQGTQEPETSLAALARMWKMMSEVGIWSPRCGIHGLSDRLQAAFLAAGGMIRRRTAVREVVVKAGRAVGVQTSSGEYVPAQWIVSNADYKKTFLEMLAPDSLPADQEQKARSLPYTGSQLCVYLGLDPATADLSRLKADHVTYRKNLATAKAGTVPQDFDCHEVEISLWSQSLPDAAPPGKIALVLRTPFDYEHFARWRTAEKRRVEGYRAYKKRLARKLIQTVDSLIPGLASAIEFMEVATPLTYRDWGNRTQGSIAGWSWSASLSPGMGLRVLVETPLERLVLCGIYSVTELFWGGVATALTTGVWAADKIL